VYERHEEVHEQRLWEVGELTAMAESAGFEVTAILDNYTPIPAHEETLRQTWLLRKVST
jgi:hypothetical protein